jgi:hypothetical protein
MNYSQLLPRLAENIDQAPVFHLKNNCSGQHTLFLFRLGSLIHKIHYILDTLQYIVISTNFGTNTDIMNSTRFLRNVIFTVLNNTSIKQDESWSYKKMEIRAVFW